MIGLSPKGRALPYPRPRSAVWTGVVSAPGNRSNLPGPQRKQPHRWVRPAGVRLALGGQRPSFGCGDEGPDGLSFRLLFLDIRLLEKLLHPLLDLCLAGRR